MATATYRIHGMDCAEEVATLRAELSPLPGVRDLAFDVLNGKLTVTFADGALSPDELTSAVNRTGMRAEPWRESREAIAEAGGWQRWGRTVMTVASGALTVAGFATHGTTAGWDAAVGGGDEASVPLLSRTLYVGATVTGAWYVTPKAVRAPLRVRPDMNLLMTVAVAGAIAIGEFFEAATVAFLFALSPGWRRGASAAPGGPSRRSWR